QKSRSSVESVDSTILYVASAGKNALDKNYRIVATVENFFEIIYNVHVELGGRNGRHAGQKRTYRIISETYAFLPREAVTKFLSICPACYKNLRQNSPCSETSTFYSANNSITSLAPSTPVESNKLEPFQNSENFDLHRNFLKQFTKLQEIVKKKNIENVETTIDFQTDEKLSIFRSPLKKELDLTKVKPITSVYLQLTRSMGLSDSDALQFNDFVSSDFKYTL
uniref:Integrase zinc-binding domain-containing protein n=1 Tax=Megaselia scalaris TaxID=36166 RepID=T1GPV2_MEGSC